MRTAPRPVRRHLQQIKPQRSYFINKLSMLVQQALAHGCCNRLIFVTGVASGDLLAMTVLLLGPCALIEVRENKKAFVSVLLELEQKKRQQEQDKTLERAEALFADTPVMRGDDFSAVSMTVAATEFES
ncbi:MAG: hypothetical protein ACPIEU_03855, partial [Candidatus Puniceispirillaceae bacterium]